MGFGGCKRKDIVGGIHSSKTKRGANKNVEVLSLRVSNCLDVWNGRFDPGEHSVKRKIDGMVILPNQFTNAIHANHDNSDWG